MEGAVSFIGGKAFGVLASRVAEGLWNRYNAAANAQSAINRLRVELDMRLKAISPQIEAVQLAAAARGDAALEGTLNMATTYIGELQSSLEQVGDTSEDAAVKTLTQFVERCDTLVPYVTMALSYMAVVAPTARVNGTAASASLLLRASAAIRRCEMSLNSEAVVIRMPARVYSYFAAANNPKWQLETLEPGFVEVVRDDSHQFSIRFTPADDEDESPDSARETDKVQFSFPCCDLLSISRALSGRLLGLDEVSQRVVTLAVRCEANQATSTRQQGVPGTPVSDAKGKRVCRRRNIAFGEVERELVPTGSDGKDERVDLVDDSSADWSVFEYVLRLCYFESIEGRDHGDADVDDVRLSAYFGEEELPDRVLRRLSYSGALSGSFRRGCKIAD